MKAKAGVQKPTLDEELRTAKLGKTAKKTGKRGPMPFDPDEDFAQPVRREPQQERLLDQEEAPPPAEVQNGFVLMKFVRCKLTKEKTGARFVNMEFSTGLTDESAPLFGRAIEERYQMLRDDAGVTELRISDMQVHTLDVAIAADMKPAVHCGIQPQKVSLAVVQEKGSGEELDVIRFSFTAPVPQSEEILGWGAYNHGNLVWLKMCQRQGRLIA